MKEEEFRLAAQENRPDKGLTNGRTPGTDSMTRLLKRAPQNFYTVRIPYKLVQMLLFPASPQKDWVALHPTKHYSIKTGVKFNDLDGSQEPLTIRDFTVWIAICTLTQNHYLEETEVEIAWRHIGYVIAGFPRVQDFDPSKVDEETIKKKTSWGNFVGGTRTEQWKKAKANLKARHLLYTKSNGLSSAPDERIALSLLDFQSVEKNLRVKNKRGTFLRNFRVSQSFDDLADDESDWVEFDVRQFMRIESDLVKSAYLKVLPRLLSKSGEGYNYTDTRPLELIGKNFIKSIGAPASYCLRESRTTEILCKIELQLNKLESVNNTRIRARVITETDGCRVNHVEGSRIAFWIERISDKAKKPKQTETLKLWEKSGGSVEQYRKRLKRGTEYSDLSESDLDYLDGYGFAWQKDEQYLKLVRKLIGPRMFEEALAEFRAAIKDPNQNAVRSPKFLIAFLKKKIESAASGS